MLLGAIAWHLRWVNKWVLAGSIVIAALPVASAVASPLRLTFDAAHQQTSYSQRQLQQWRSRMDAPLSRFIREPTERYELLTRLYQEARLAGLPPELVLSLIQVESAFKSDAVSSAGAVGLMQIMPFWIEELGLPMDNLSDPNRNLRYGCTILAHYLAVERGDFTRALARYNGSLGQTWYPERVLKAWRDDWR
ncbi:transglycosylase SLT domain-containing protein [Halomonas sp. TD01]|uniref:transglycosylase SLT domain-containing protein n=1 Tax=Halomonas sp. TD01 TaxID=999141 RepID=UPI001E7BE2B5|nr:transglycosylase SLT domain-containing protein [Halomonas sp. TD01]CAH1044354.1 FIG016425: Soluble lytic murein transglycosylase and related regulatory proteins (some contain LysM/invasin domains) [Halomonas sp. TD01]